MNIAIYQIDRRKDENRVAFLPFDSLNHYQTDAKIDSAIYEKVYEGNVEANDLEDIFRIFNSALPKDYTGRSLSVSDITLADESIRFMRVTRSRSW